MSVKERILIIRLTEKVKQNPLLGQLLVENASDPVPKPFLKIKEE